MPLLKQMNVLLILTDAGITQLLIWETEVKRKHHSFLALVPSFIKQQMSNYQTLHIQL